MDLKEIGINMRNWVDSTQDRGYWRALVNAALNLLVPYAMELVKGQEHEHLNVNSAFTLRKSSRMPCWLELNFCLKCRVKAY